MPNPSLLGPNQDLRRRRLAAVDAGIGARPAHRRVHHQPDADAQGRHLRLPRLRQGGSGGDQGPADLVRGVRRRHREMRRQAREIATWGDNVYVKIPVTNTRREPTTELVRELAGAGVKLNVTAICTLEQVRDVARGARGWGALGRLGVRRPHRRHRPRSDPAHAGVAVDLPRPPASRSSCSGPARASSSTSSRRPRSAATSSPSRPIC